MPRLTDDTVRDHVLSVLADYPGGLTVQMITDAIPGVGPGRVRVAVDELRDPPGGGRARVVEDVTAGPLRASRWRLSYDGRKAVTAARRRLRPSRAEHPA